MTTDETGMRPELVAPAGCLETLEAAVTAGADAVYVGLRHLSARAHAPNFGLDELARGARVAHSRGARVFVALNTLVRPEEIPIARELLAGAREAGADAFIVQDLGLLRLAADVAPGLPLHASTQLGVRAVEGVRVLGALGVRRAVLARELSVAEIEAIAAAVPEVELEVFVHGALCYGASGLCLLSALTTGRSGNRGRCTQPCRRPFSLTSGERRNVFNMSDLWGLEYLPALARIGVRALKIEGRLRSAEYVTASVRTYRAALDGSVDAARDARRADLGPRAVLSLFGRRMSGGFLGGEEALDRANPDPLYQGHRGFPVGETVAAPAGRIRVRCQAPFGSGDGLLLERHDAPPYHLRLPEQLRVVGRRALTSSSLEAGAVVELDAPPSLIPVGADVFLVIARDVKAACAPPVVPRPEPVAVRTVLAGDGETLWLSAALERGRVVAEYPLLSEKRFAPLEMREVARLLAGDEVGGLRLAPEVGDATGCYRVPPKAIRRVRRDFLRRVGLYVDVARDGSQGITLPSDDQPGGARVPAAPRLIVRVDNRDHITSTVRCRADEIELLAHGSRDDRWIPRWIERERAAGSALAFDECRITLVLPPVLRESARPRLESLLRATWELGVRRFEVGSLDGLGLVREVLPRGARVSGDHTLYVFNEMAARLLYDELGLERVTLPLEADRALLARLVALLGERAVMLIHGDPPLMRGAISPGMVELQRGSAALLRDEHGVGLRLRRQGSREFLVGLSESYSRVGRRSAPGRLGASNLRIEFAHRCYGASAINGVFSALSESGVGVK